MAKAIGTFPYYGGKQRLYHAGAKPVQGVSANRFRGGKGSPATEQSVCRALDGFADDLQAVVKNMAYQWQEYAAKVNRHLFCVGRQLSVRRLLPFGLLRHFAAIRPMNGNNLRHYHVLPKCGYQR